MFFFWIIGRQRSLLDEVFGPTFEVATRGDVGLSRREDDARAAWRDEVAPRVPRETRGEGGDERCAR